MTAYSHILEAAKRLADASPAWADLSNALFDSQNGLVIREFPDLHERKAFLQSPEYRAIRGLLLSAMERSGLVAGATPQKSGRFVVRLPKSLHAALEREAAREGVSLNQLVLAKLAVQLSDLAAVGHGETPAALQSPRASGP